MTDHCDREGANALKTRIETYWRERGAVVTVELVASPYLPAMRIARVDVRSDMLNGLPRGWVEK